MVIGCYPLCIISWMLSKIYLIFYIRKIAYNIYIVLPFDEDNANELFKKICTGDFRYPQTFSNEVIDLLNNILVVDPNKRYTLQDIKSHPWFQSQKEEDEYYTPIMISADLDNDNDDNDDNQQEKKPRMPTQIETPRSSKKYKRAQKSSEDWMDNDSNGSNIHPALEGVHSFDYVQQRVGFEQEEEKKEVKRSKSQKGALKISPLANTKNPPPNTKRKSIQICLSKYDETKESKESQQTYDQTMEQYPQQINNNNTNFLPVGDNGSDISDYQTSDIDSSPSMSPRQNIEPISMTAFDLIGIVSTQMLNNVFTRSLQDTSTQIKTYTRFVSQANPPKILYAIQEAVHRIADCTCRVASDRYEIKVIKRKGHRTIHINIQIFQTPVVSEYMIECRRTQGNIFKYHEFFEEFEKQYKNVIEHLDKGGPNTPPNEMINNHNKRRKPQIKFRNKESIDEMVTNETNTTLNSKHSRSVSENAAFINNNSNNSNKSLQQPVVKKVSSNPPSDNNKNNDNNNNNILPSMQELTHSLSQPSHKKRNPSNVSIKSSASSGSTSHHSSISSVSEQKENLNLNSSASPTPTHQQNNSNHSFSMEELNHSDSSLIEYNEYESIDNDNNNNQNNNNKSLKQPADTKRHRRSSSGKTYGVTKSGHLNIPSKVPESGK